MVDEWNLQRMCRTHKWCKQLEWSCGYWRQSLHYIKNKGKNSLNLLNWIQDDTIMDLNERRQDRVFDRTVFNMNTYLDWRPVPVHRQQSASIQSKMISLNSINTRQAYMRRIWTYIHYGKHHRTKHPQTAIKARLQILLNENWIKSRLMRMLLAGLPRKSTLCSSCEILASKMCSWRNPSELRRRIRINTGCQMSTLRWAIQQTLFHLWNCVFSKKYKSISRY